MKTLLTAAAVFLGATLATSASAQNVGIATSNPGSLFHNIHHPLLQSGSLHS